MELRDQNNTFGPIIKETMKTLEANDWKKLFRYHGPRIFKKLKEYKKKGSTIRRVLNYYICKAVGEPVEDLQLYTTVSKASEGKMYDLRFRGQHMCNVDINKKGKPQLHPYASSKENAQDWHELEPQFEKKVEVRSNEAYDFFKKFSTYTGKLRSPEHELESLVLRNIAVTSGYLKKAPLRNMQPIKLGNGFFQLPTKLTASNMVWKDGVKTHKIDFSEGAGGGIDIFARVSKKEVGWRFAVIELKDQNKPDEDIELAMKQAMAYATLVALLLTDEELGRMWYNIFREKNDEKDFKDVPQKIEILVMAMMPRKEDGSKEKPIEETPMEIKLGNRSVKFMPCTCYLKSDDHDFVDSQSSFLRHKRTT